MNQSRIKCPYCGEEIAATAKKCRFCDEWLPNAETSSQPQIQQPQMQQGLNQQPTYQQPQQPTYQQPQQQTYQQTQQPIYQQPQQPVYQQPTYQLPYYQQPVYQTPAVPEVEKDDEEDEDDDYTPSFFEAYFKWSFFNEYKDFGGYTGRKSFWLSMVALLIINLGVTGLALLIVALSGMAAGGLLAAGILIAVWSVAMIVPSIAIGCRRLRDAGKSPKLYLLCLIPIVGPIILLVLWCQVSKYEDTDYYAEFRQVDIAVTAVSLVLFISSLLALNNSFGSIISGIDDYDTEYSIDEEDENLISDDDNAISDEDDSSVTDDYSSSSANNTTESVTYTNYSGIINGKYKIRMTLNSEGHGEYYYTKYGPNNTLTLIITELDDNGNITIEEYNDKGEQTGLFDGLIENNGDISGTFTNYQGKLMPFYLEQL